MCSDLCTAADIQVVGKTRLSSAHDIIAKRAASCNSRLGDKYAVIPDFVIMRNLHQIIDTAAVPDNRVVQSASVNTGICSDFNIITDNNPSDLGNSFMLPVNNGKTKPVLSDSCPCINITVVSHQAVSYTRVIADSTVVANLTASGDNRISLYDTVITDNYVVFNNGVWTNKTAFAYFCRFGNGCTFRNTGNWFVLGIKGTD